MEVNRQRNVPHKKKKTTDDTVARLIDSFPSQILTGLAAGKNAVKLLGERRQSWEKRLRRCRTIIVCGMGGSALPGLLLQQQVVTGEWRTAKDIVVHRNYGLPFVMGRKPSGVICISYSGNTEETLSAYGEARRKRLPVLVIASGGTLAQWAERDSVPFARIPGDVPPRFGISYQFGALVALLSDLAILSRRAAKELHRAAQSLDSSSVRPHALRALKILKNHIPLIYASEEDAALAYVLKIQMNENAKIHAFSHVLPEMNHNELNAYATLSQPQRVLQKPFAIAIVEPRKPTQKLTKRIRATASIITAAGFPVIRMSIPGTTPTVRLLNGIIVGEWLSTILALSYGIDPLPTDLIETFKTMLRDERGKNERVIN